MTNELIKCIEQLDKGIAAVKENLNQKKEDYCNNCPYYDKAKELMNIEANIYCGTEDHVDFFK